MTSRQNIKPSAAQRLVMQPLTDAAMREALDEFELVCENNDVRKLTDDEKFAAQEFALSLIHGAPSAEAEATEKLAPMLTLTGAQLLEALDLIAPDRTADQLESEGSFQYGKGHAGEGMYCWITEYPEEGASLLDGSTVSAQAVAADGAAMDEISGECFIVIGHGESDIPEAKIIARREDLLDVVLGMIYTHASEAPDDVRAEYAESLADDDEWAADKWSVDFEIGGIVIWRVGLHPVRVRAAVSPATAEACAHDYVRLDGICIGCGEKPATADERAANPVNTTERDHSFIDNDLDFEPDAQHAVADMANIGYALMQTIERMAPGYCWNESPTEIVSDLINERDEARASQAAAPADARPTSFHFHRFVNGQEMAEDVLIERATTIEAAIKEAVRICPKRPMTVLVHAPAWVGALCGGVLAKPVAPAEAREPIYQSRLLKAPAWTDVSRTEFEACAAKPDQFEVRTLPPVTADAGEAVVLRAEVNRLNAIINTPQAGDFLRAVSIEAEHQRQRWSSKHDSGKMPADWFWLVGYLAGKALHAHAVCDEKKAEHHIITTAAALANWHLAIFGKSDMQPGIEPPIGAARDGGES
ncbi:hypothetical protein [Burkholderia gladioli]|uniref:hypothetical protein n=1 Tax=Burkholderia gladioli TaxID=28095 RepID=UPI001ABB5FF8|nr:hypothetical protein [Burkholderia gladioli]